MSPEEYQRLVMMQQNAFLGQLGQTQPITPVERTDMQVCDLIGWRAWRITASGYLQSAAVETLWLPGEQMTGEVGDHNGRGVHAYKSRSDALIHGISGTRVARGSILLWGEIVEHERGYRAEHAKVLTIDDVTWDAEPPWSETIAKALAFLCDRYAVNRGE